VRFFQFEYIYLKKNIMKNTYNSINENEKKRILEMHKKGGYTSLNEQSEPTLNNRFTGDKYTRIPGSDDDSRPAQNKIIIPKDITIDGSLFKNGIANIDKSNPQYQTAIKELKKLPADMTVNIEGGASAVGSPKYDNNKLANLRATNFINAARQDGVKVNMTPSGFVGSAKVKNSPQAEAEQYVKINFTQGGGYRPETAVGNTRTDKRLGGDTFLDPEKIKRGIKRYKICLKDLTYDEYINVFRTYNSKNKIDRGSISSK
jgi:hypothetical protein